MCVLLSLRECDTSLTGENIFSLMYEELVKRNIAWSNCICFAADNASVMQGKAKRVVAYLAKQNPAIFMFGCACHLVHLAAGKAAAVLLVWVDELLIDIYYHLNKSSKLCQGMQFTRNSMMCRAHGCPRARNFALCHGNRKFSAEFRSAAEKRQIVVFVAEFDMSSKKLALNLASGWCQSYKFIKPHRLWPTIDAACLSKLVPCPYTTHIIRWL